MHVYHSFTKIVTWIKPSIVCQQKVIKVIIAARSSETSNNGLKLTEKNIFKYQPGIKITITEQLPRRY
jgi:hypothetical protein